MSLRYAILGLLSRESMTGYDLTKQFDTTIGFFWSAKHSQIYPELAALTKEGLVTFEVVTQTSKPNKKVYTLTPTGHEALARWVAEPRDRRTVKDPLLLRSWTIGVVDPALGLAHLREALGEWEVRCAYLEQVEERANEEMQTPDRLWDGPYITLRLGRMQAQSYREWLRWAIEHLETARAAEPEAPVSQA